MKEFGKNLTDRKRVEKRGRNRLTDAGQQGAAGLVRAPFLFLFRPITVHILAQVGVSSFFAPFYAFIKQSGRNTPPNQSIYKFSFLKEVLRGEKSRPQPD